MNLGKELTHFEITHFDILYFNDVLSSTIVRVSERKMNKKWGPVNLLIINKMWRSYAGAIKRNMLSADGDGKSRSKMVFQLRVTACRSPQNNSLQRSRSRFRIIYSGRIIYGRRFLTLSSNTHCSTGKIFRVLLFLTGPVLIAYAGSDKVSLDRRWHLAK